MTPPDLAGSAHPPTEPASTNVVWLWADSESDAVWCDPCLDWILDGTTCAHLDVRRQVFGALARAEALAAGFDRWTEVKRWPFAPGDFESSPCSPTREECTGDAPCASCPRREAS